MIFSKKIEIFDFFVKNEEKFKRSLIDAGGLQGGEVGSASPPGGNLVDGLPPASSSCEFNNKFKLYIEALDGDS